MGIIVHDTDKKLSKNQLLKIKTSVLEYLKNNDDTKLQIFLDKEVLTHIHPSESYNDISFTKNEHYEIFLKNVVKIDPRQKLKEKIMIQNKLRKNSDDKDSRLWKLYDTLSKQSRVRLPTPTEIKNNAQIYEPMLEQIPNKIFKEYISSCIN